MEQLTPEQRIEAYEYALKEMYERGNLWICVRLHFWLEFNGYDNARISVLEIFPEFAKLKPDPLPFKGSASWWSPDKAGHRSRIAALEQCIKECLLLINQPTGQ